MPDLAPLLPLGGLIAVLCVSDGPPPLLGLKRAPIQGWGYWCRIALWFGGAILLLSLVVGGFFWLNGWTIPYRRLDPQDSVPVFVAICLYAPLAEEVVYRALLAVAVAPTFGHWGTIIASGVVFALLHVLYGNPGPDNFVAGFLLMWAFLKSGTILVPLAMHAAGNGIALGSHIVNWYWLPPEVS